MFWGATAQTVALTVAVVIALPLWGLQWSQVRVPELLRQRLEVGVQLWTFFLDLG